MSHGDMVYLLYSFERQVEPAVRPAGAWEGVKAGAWGLGPGAWVVRVMGRWSRRYGQRVRGERVKAGAWGLGGQGCGQVEPALRPEGAWGKGESGRLGLGVWGLGGQVEPAARPAGAGM